MKKSKIVSLALAGTLTVTALLAGTYAWTSISQQALNEAEGTVNPGGRLHDDFNGTNKDIYVENFTDAEGSEEGAVIYARIRLAEYLKIGEKVMDTDDDPKNGPTFDTPSTWTTFKLKDEEDSIYRKFFKWTWGEGTEYLPTFNKNKDSLEADINGTLGGIDGDKDINKAYDDYVAYDDAGEAFEDVVNQEGIVPENTTVGSRYGIEIYDIDEDARDEDEYLNEAIIKTFHAGNGKIISSFDGTNPIDTETNNTVSLTGTDENTVTAQVTAIEKSGEDVVAIELDLQRDEDASNGEKEDEADIRIEATNTAHTVKATLNTLGVITMEEWKAMNCPKGAYWVYDTDGWAYWAQGIEPGTATGCLLTGIEKTGSIVDKYHYAINVTAEFATAGDWGESAEDAADGEAKGFYINTITPDGLYLLNTIAGAEKDIMVTASSTSAVKPGESVDLSAEVLLGAQPLDDAVTWTLEDSENPNTGKSSGTEIKPTVITTDEGESVTVGRLTIGEDETLKSIVVTAYLAEMPEIKTTRRIYVGEKLEVTVATADNAENLVVPENIEELALDAKVMNQWGVESVGAAVTWELVPESYTDEKQSGTATVSEGEEGAEAEEDTDYTYIDANGVLHIGTDEKSKEIQVVAKVDDGGTIRESEAFAVNLNTQLEYIASIDMDEIPADDRTAIVDGVEWYVLRKDDVSGDGADDALLWAKEPVEGWLRGNQAADNTWVGWSYYNASEKVPFKTTESVASDGRNWWRYSNLRTWLNSTGEDTGNVMKFDEKDKPYWSDETTTYYGFLNGKTILANNAVPTVIYTRKEFDKTGLNEDDFDVVGDGTPENPGDKVFIFTQADIFGHASGLIQDENGDKVVDDVKYKYVANGEAVAKDYTVDDKLWTEITDNMRTTSSIKWNWLRSPRNFANNVSYVDSDGNVGDPHYENTRGYVRPALWLNLSSSAQ